jgi:hypothetical protein
MKFPSKNIAILFILLILNIVGCAQSNLAMAPTPTLYMQPTKSVATATLNPSPTSLSTSTVRKVTPYMGATPISAQIKTSTDLDNIMWQLFPMLCNKHNILLETPVPIDAHPPTILSINQVESLPDPNLYWVSAIADSVDKNRRAYIAGKQGFAENIILVKDNNTNKVFEIHYEILSGRWVERLRWINNDILIFFQSGSPHMGFIYAVNIDQNKYEYFGFDSLQCQTLHSTPTP